MVKVAALFATLSVLLAGAAATRGGQNDADACPKGYRMKHVKGWGWGGCQCIDDQYKSAPLTRGWSVSAHQDHKGAWTCKPQCDTPPEPPKPSPSGHTGGHNGGHNGGGYNNGGHNGGSHNGGGYNGGGHNGGGWGGNHGHWKRRADLQVAFCPANTLACPIVVPGVAPSDLEVECIHPKEDLDNCGACGNSCVVPGVKGTACVSGRCEIYSCAPGYKLATVNGAAACEASL